MALTKIDDRGLKTPIDLLDNEKIRFGTGNDLEIYHVGTDGNYSYITDSSGRVYLKSNRFYGQAADGVNQIYWEADGATNLYYDGSLKLGTYSNGINVSGRIQFTDVGLTDVIEVPDSKKITVGSGGDMSFYHNGSNGWNYIQSLANNIAIQAKTGENSVTCYADDKVELYFDHSKKFETRSGGIGVFGHYEAGDNNKIMLGDSNDLQIYHDGSNSYIDDAGTGNLYLRGSASIELRKAGGVEKMLYAEPDAAVELYYDNSLKARTATWGWEVFGNIHGDDDCSLNLGTSNDLQIYHDGNHNYIKCINGNLRIWSSASSEAIFCAADGSTLLAYGNSPKLETISTGINVTGGIRLGGNNAANEMGDYEEGTWTPETVTGTWGQVTGYYTKIGQQVFLTAYMYGCNTTSGSDLVKVDNLPFAPISGMTCGTVITEGSNAFTVAYMNGAGYIVLAQNDGGSSIHYMEHSDISAGGSTGRLHINANYRTNA